MSNIKEYKELAAFHPGYYVAEIIEDMGINQAEFAMRMGTTAKTLSQLLNGHANISNDLAKKLSVMLGTGVEVWQNLQDTYDRKLIEIQKEKDFDEQNTILGQIDYAYFVKVANLPATRQPKEKIAYLCEFLKVSDLRIMERPDFLVNFRSVSASDTEKNAINSRAWIQTAINFSKDMEVKPYSKEKLRASLSEIRNMTTQPPEIFLPRMKEIFAECGVAFVLLPHLKNASVNGAVKWVSEDRAVLAMNNRGVYADKFWFSLFHEIQHVFQQKVKTIFVSSSSQEKILINEELERDANEFASNFLIPPAELKKFAPTRYTSDQEIIGFAEKIGIHPGIVAGRLQHDKIIPQNRCTKLKEKYVMENM